MTTHPTLNGNPLRVIYTANGDLWARDVIANPPKPSKKTTRGKRRAALRNDPLRRKIFLVALDSLNGATSADVSGRLKIKKSHASTELNYMASMGYIKRTGSDGKLNLYSATKAGISIARSDSK